MNKRLLALILLSPWVASAEEVTVYFSGEVNFITQDTAGLFAGAGVVPGAKVTGSFVYDTTTSNLSADTATGDVWPYLDFSVDSLPEEFTPIAITARDPLNDDDRWLVNATWDALPGGVIGFEAVGDLGFQTSDSTASGYVGLGLGHETIIVFPPLTGGGIFGGGIVYGFVDTESQFQFGLAGVGPVQFSFDPFVEDLVGNIVEIVMDLNVNNGIMNSLDSKLDTVLQALDDVNEINDVAAINSLNAFINAVEAQRGKKLEEADACSLIEAADSIIVLLGGASTGSTCLSQQ